MANDNVVDFAALGAPPAPEQPVPPAPRQVGPCEATFNDMMRQVEAQMQRAHLAATSPDQRPEVDIFKLMRSMMRAIDGILASYVGDLLAENESLGNAVEELRRDLGTRLDRLQAQLDGEPVGDGALDLARHGLHVVDAPSVREID